MKRFDGRREAKGQTHQEMLWVIVISCVALVALLSVFVPALRHFWLAVGRLFIG